MLQIFGGLETNPGPSHEKRLEATKTLISTPREVEVTDVLRSCIPAHTNTQKVRNTNIKHDIRTLKGVTLFSQCKAASP